jgi:hypothetical protein
MQAQNEEEVGHISEPSPYYYMPNHKQGTNHKVGLASPLRRYQSDEYDFAELPTVVIVPCSIDCSFSWYRHRSNYGRH